MGAPLSPAARAGLGAAGLAVGLGAAAAQLWGGYDVSAGSVVLDLVIGWSFIGAGASAWIRDPDSRTGLLTVVFGFAWFARSAVAVAAPGAFVVGVVLGSIHLAVLVHLLATFPTGRTRTWPERAVVSAGYLVFVPLDALLLLSAGGVPGMDVGVRSVVVVLLGSCSP